MARDLGTAFVTIKPDTLGFTASLKAKLKAALTGVDANVPLGLDLLKLNRDKEVLKAQLKTITERAQEIRIDLKDTGALLKISAIDLALRRLRRSLAQPDIGPKGLDRALRDLVNISHALQDIDVRGRGFLGWARQLPAVIGRAALSLVTLGFLGRRSGGGGGGGGGGGIESGLIALGPGGRGAVQGFASLPWQLQAGLVAAAAAAAPFIAQVFAGAIVSALGLGLVGLGIAGALVTGTAPKAGTTAQLQAATLRVAAAQARLNALMGQGGASTLALQAAQLRLTAAQDRLNALRKSGTGTAAQLASAEASVASAQNRLNNLNAKGGASTAQLASAQATLISAQDRLNKLQGQSTALAQFNAQNKLQLQARAAFTKLSEDAQASLRQIGVSFVPVMLSIFKTADSVLKKLTPVFAGAVKVISGPFKAVADAILTSFTQPAVVSSINDIAKAFADILTAGLPMIAGGISDIAVGISKLAKAVDQNPRVFALFVKFLFDLVGGLFTALGWLTKVADYIEQHFGPALHRVAVIFDGVRHEIAHITDLIIQTFIGIGEKIARPFIVAFDAVKSWISRNFDDWWKTHGQSVIDIWQAVWTRVKGIVEDIVRPIAESAKLIWKGLTRIFQQGFDDLKSDTDIFQTGWKVFWNIIITTVKTTWRIITTLLKIAWTTVETAFSVFLDVLTGHWKTAWDDMKTYVGRIWGDIKSLISTPVKWIVNNILDKLFTVIDTVTNFVGLGKPIPIIKMAGGGRLAGFGGGDAVPALLERGETVVSKDTTRQFAPLLKMMGIPGFAAGGIVGGIGGALAAIATGNSTALANSIFSLAGGHGKAPGGQFGADLLALPGVLVKDVVKWIIKQVGGIFSNRSSFLSGFTVNWIEQAIRLAGKPQSWLNPLSVLVSKESGGNPNAVNTTAVMGQHATGMWQMLPSTFLQYANGLPLSAIWNPVLEGTAALRYISAVYGSPFNIPGLLSGSYQGYGSGGVVADHGAILRPGANVLFNRTGANEPLVPAGAEVHVHLHNHGVIGSQAELDRWVVASINRAAQASRLRWAFRQSPSAV